MRRYRSQLYARGNQMSDPYEQLMDAFWNEPFEVINTEYIKRKCNELGLQLVIKEKERGDGRKQHYGADRQPIDDIMLFGWGPQFCAGNVLKYLRRDKAREHSLESARVYWRWLCDLADMDAGKIPHKKEWAPAMGLATQRRLCAELTVDEYELLTGDKS